MGESILVIGCGASGLMAAISAARMGASVTILETGKKPAAKLLMTGNGHCNMTNLDPQLWTRYHSSSPQQLGHFTNALRRQLDVPETLKLFREIGLLTTSKGNLVYPHSEQAKSVLEVLQAEARRLKVKIKLAGKVQKIRKDEITGKWSALTDTWEYTADKLVLCAGSCAAPDTGSDGSGYELARSAGHTIIRPLPALTGLLCGRDAKALSSAQGARTDGIVRLFAVQNGTTEVLPETLIASDEGQIQWTKDGISGVVVFQLSAAASGALAKGCDVWVTIDLVPDIPERELASFIEETLNLLIPATMIKADAMKPETVTAQLVTPELIKKINAPLSQVLSGIVNDRLTELILSKLSDSNSQNPPASLSERAAYILKNLPLKITGTRSFDQAQVCAGGVRLDEIDPETLESRLAPGLYFAGEILDVDGPCGGYNLQWAWSTGYAAGRSSAEKESGL